MKGQIYQGDVMIERIASLPSGTRKVRTNGLLAEGEATGHHHSVAVLDAAEVLEIGDGLYLNVTAEGGVSIVHQEHDAVHVDPGIYRVVRQREYDSAEGWRQTRD